MTLHPSPFTLHGLFVTGTDTAVGKTLMTCALLHAYAARGLHVVGMKPVAAGAQWHADGLRNDDVEQILEAGNVAAPRELVNPYCFEPAIAPHIAARIAGTEIDLLHLERAYAALGAMADMVVVEGAGGFCVPLNAREDTADLAQRLRLPVLLVVGMRLGCLNHALLTAQAIHARGLKLAGWVANHIDPQMMQAEDNVAALSERLGAPPVARIAFSPCPDPRAIATSLDIDQSGYFG
ncbi:MAG: dethiobiotin synthase [Burkholderiales bacterium]|nr:dethiobiotin synthase [Burkholderiales bacterium]